MQTLRKKTSPLKFKNETTRFLGDGVSFKAKLIGILEVSEARGDRMCQEALCDLKMAIRAAGEHKQRITVNIAIDGLRLRDEKTGDCLYHHPVHKISFIAQDMTDSRAFGYIFGSPDTGHRFFGIKTDKAASQVVIAMRDLFQVVFALKKKEIELAKQHLEKSYIPTSPLFSESPPTSASKVRRKKTWPSEKPKNEPKSGCGAGSLESKGGGTAVADLVDLELELNSLQQGLNQMERITPSDPFGSKDDPFGDSFTSYPINKLILPPPPPSGRDRSSRTSEGSNSTKTPPNTAASIDSASDSTLFSAKTNKEFSFSSRDFNSSHEEPGGGDWFNPSFGNSIFEEAVAPCGDVATKDEKHEAAKQEIMSQFDVFTELDPLELKNPPKKALNELAVSSGTTAATSSATPDLFFNQSQTGKMQNSAPYSNSVASANVFTSDPFGEDPFVREDPFADSDFSKQDPFETEFAAKELQAILQSSNHPNNVYRPPLMAPVLGVSPKTVQFGAQIEPESAPEPPPRPVTAVGGIQPPPLPPKKQSDIVLKPPPRPPHLEDARYDYLENIEKSAIDNQPGAGGGGGGGEDVSPPLPLPQRKTTRFESDFIGAVPPPERPRKQNQQLSSDEDYLTPISFPERPGSPSGVLLPPPPQRQTKKDPQSVDESGPDSLEGLDMTLSQLTLSGLNELASKLKIPPHKLSNMTLVQLTNYLSTFIKTQQQQHQQQQQQQQRGVKNGTEEKFPAFRADFAANFDNGADAAIHPPADPPTYDRYAVFRELQEEIKQTRIDTEPEEIREAKELDEQVATANDDKYAALREIVDIEIKRSVTPKETQQQPQQEEEDQDKRVTGVVTLESVHLANGKEQSTDVNAPALNHMSKANIIEYMAEPQKEEKAAAAATAAAGAASIIVAPTVAPSAKSPTPKSPVPSAVTEIIQTSVRMTSGSLSDVLSGSSPEVDNTGSNSDVPKKVPDPAGDSWAIFDQPPVPPPEAKEEDNLPATHSEEGVSPWSSDSKEFGNRSPTDWKKRDTKQSERRKKHRDQEGGWWDTSADPEGPYYAGNRRSTDSYEEEYYECYDRPRRRRPAAGQQFASAGGGHSSSSRDVSPWEEEQPRRRGDGRSGWARHSRGHSFERHRDPKHTDSWDDEDDYDYGDEHRSRGHYFQRHGSKDSERHSSAGSREMDSDRWDDYGQERANRYRRRRDAGRTDGKELKEGRRCCPDWEQSEHEKGGRYAARRGTSVSERRDRYDERYRSSRESQDSPWEDEYANEPEEPPPPPPPPHSPHYLSAKKRDNWKQRPSSASEMDRKTGEIKSRHHMGTGGSDGERDRRYKASRRSRSRDSSQYNEALPPPASSSASSSRHKPDTGPMRGPHRLKSHKVAETEYAVEKKSPLNDAIEPPAGGGTKKLLTSSLSLSAANRKKLGKDAKNEPTSGAVATANTLPRKGASAARSKSMFDHNYGGGCANDTPMLREGGGSKFSFEIDEFDKVEGQSSSAVNRPIKGLKQHSLFDKTQLRLEKSFKDRRGDSLQDSKLSPRFQTKPRSPFEDDFSPSEKPDAVPEGNGISCIKEEPDTVEDEEEDSFGTPSQNVRTTTAAAAHERRRALNKSRLSSSSGRNDVNLKKSGSVNIFARESDPFDDDFFSGANMGNRERGPRRSTELKWTDDFEDSDNGRK